MAALTIYPCEGPHVDLDLDLAVRLVGLIGKPILVRTDHGGLWQRWDRLTYVYVNHDARLCFNAERDNGDFTCGDYRFFDIIEADPIATEPRGLGHDPDEHDPHCPLTGRPACNTMSPSECRTCAITH